MKKLKSNHASSEKRISDIIQAALGCFTELGFNDTTMADICTRANASTGSIYHHFKSKEQLAAVVYLEGIGQYQSGMIKIFEEEEDAFRGIASIIEYHLTWVCKNTEWANYLFQKKNISVVSETEDALLELNKKFITVMTGWFRHNMDAGRIHRVSWDILVALLLGPCQEYTRLYLSKKTITKIDKAASELSQAVWRSLSTER